MVKVHILILFVLLMATSGILCAEVLSERSREVEFGFREVYLSETAPPGHWEGAMHFRFLYYRDQKLSQYGTYSIAPSGHAVIFQDGPSGNVMVFYSTSSSTRTLLKFGGSLVKEYRWVPNEQQVMVVFESNETATLDIQ